MQMTTLAARGILAAATGMPRHPGLLQACGASRPDSEPESRGGGEDVGGLLVELFRSLGRAAAVVGAEGRVVHLNPQAERLAGNGFALARQHLRATRPNCQDSFRAAMDCALGGSGTVQTLALRRSQKTTPLLVRVVPIGPASRSEATALVLFTDPEVGQGEGVQELLRMIGLTPRQARIAALIGSGCSPREAADKLGITQNTVRSTLKAIYGKLGLRRQSELAQLVARLEAT